MFDQHMLMSDVLLRHFAHFGSMFDVNNDILIKPWAAACAKRFRISREKFTKADNSPAAWIQCHRTSAQLRKDPTRLAPHSYLATDQPLSAGGRIK